MPAPNTPRQAPRSAAPDGTTAPTFEARHAAVLVDGANYFAALRAALLEARHTVLIAGWDVDSRTAIRGAARPRDGAPETLGALLAYLVRRRHDLQIYVLLWDYSMLYAAEREPLPRLNLDWRTPPNVHVCLDAALPIGASHHQKLVVIDDALAFCGGLDLTIRRWDTPAHRPDEPGRRDPGGRPYGPFHDLQMAVSGPVARALGALVRERWSAAGGLAAPPALETEQPGDAPWPFDAAPDFADVAVRIVRTRAAYEARSPLREVETAFVEAIGRAERFVYIESQYLTATVIADALRRRLDEVAGLEVLLVTSTMPSGWLEMRTMGAGRTRFRTRLDEQQHGSRVRIVYPYVDTDRGERADVKVHAKLMIVDDRYLQIGSSNLNNRSMSFDTECDLIVEADEEAQRDAIAGVRRRLLAEHLGLEPDDVAALESRRGALLDMLDAAPTTARGLAAVPPGEPVEDVVMATLAQMADPEAPLDPEAFVGDLFGAKHVRPLLRRGVRLALATALLVGLLAAWQLLSADWFSPENLAQQLRALGTSAWGIPVVLAIYVVGSLVVFPVTVLIATTAVVFEPWRGFGLALTGSLLGASAGFAVGRAIGKRLYGTMLGDRIAAVARRLPSGGVLPVLILRNLPVAPFTVFNVAAGVSHVRFIDYLLGTALGMGPAIAALTLLGSRLRDLWQHPSAANVALLGLAIGAWIALALALQWLSNRARRLER